MGYRVIYNFSDGTSEDLLQQVFDTEEEAETAAQIGAEAYDSGNDVLKLAGESYSESRLIDWDIVED